MLRSDCPPWLPTLAAAVTLVAGCGRSGETDDRRTEAADNAIHAALSGRLTGIDPLDAGEASFAVGLDIFETLFQYHPLKRPYEVIPCLAASLPEVSEDGLTYTFRLRDDVYFQDDPAFPRGTGRKLLAEDFIYAWARIADPHNASPHWPLLRGHIVGLDAYRAAAKTRKKEPLEAIPVIDGLSAPDPRTLRVKLVEPWPQILYVLAYLPTAPVAREVVLAHGDDFPRHPVGTGPYRVQTWRQDVEISLSRNPRFRVERYPTEGAAGDREAGLLADAGRRMPLIDRVVFRFIQAAEPTWLMFLDGRLDYHGVPGSNFDQVIGPGRTLTGPMKARGLVLQLFKSSFSRWVGVNMRDPLMGTNKPLRQALSLALDRAEFNEVFQTGRGDLPTGIMPPAFKEWDPSRLHPMVRTDLDAARALLRDARRLHGGPIPPLHMIFEGQAGVQREVGQLLVRNLAKVGVTLVVEHVDEATRPDELAATRPVQLFFGLGYRAAYPDASDLFRRFHGPNTENGSNPFGYENQTFDALFEQARVMPDTPARAAIYRRLETILLDDLPCIPYLDYNHFFVSHDWLRNAKPHAFYGPSGMAKYLRIDVQRRVAAAAL